MSATVVVCSFLTGEMSVRYSLGNASSFLWEVQAEAGLGVHEGFGSRKGREAGVSRESLRPLCTSDSFCQPQKQLLLPL